jgi:adenylosuccinate synthase
VRIRGESTGRCGWFDTVTARYGQLLNGVDTVDLTKLDDFDEIPVCVADRLYGETVHTFPQDRHPKCGAGGQADG